MNTPSMLDNISRHDLAELVELLQDSVHGGASVGFLAPLEHGEASRYWQTLAANLAEPGARLHCWVIRQQGRIIASVQLARCSKPNAPHRGEIQKLMVHRSARGQGLARLLMQHAESAAVAAGCRLLVLDTDSSSPAAALYPRLGWQHAGDIPGYALTPDGRLHTTRYFYKTLAPRD